MKRVRLRQIRLAIVLLGATAASADSETARKIAMLRSLNAPNVPAIGRDVVTPSVCSRASAPARDDPGTRVAVMRAVRDASVRYGVSAGLIRSVIRHESNGHPSAVSHAGAMGLMQLMPRTAKALGVRCAFDPRENILGGTRYLRELHDQFGSWRLALFAYNAGPTRAASGRMPAETRVYVERVMRSWRGS